MGTRGTRMCVAACVVASMLVAAPPAGAVTHTTCAGLQNAIDNAVGGAVIQLMGPQCAANVTVNNTVAFTLEGDTGGTVLTPTVASTPIIQAPAGDPVHFTLSGLTFSGMNGNPAVFLGDPGEAVTITGDTFTNNTYSSGFGAAISIQTQSNPGTVATQPTVVSDNSFSGNRAADGGAVALLGQNPITLSGNVFDTNAAAGQGGAVDIGGAAAPSTSAIQISSNIFGQSGPTGNSAGQAGGAVAVTPGSGETTTISGNTFQDEGITGSAVRDREGGALYIYGANDPSIAVTQSHNTFADNAITATQATPTPLLLAAGGAEFVLGGAVQSTGDRFFRSRVAANDGDPPYGGAVGALASGGTQVVPGVFVGTNDLFMGNTTAAGGWGGAIYVGGPPPACTGSCPASSVTLTNSTVVGNSVDAGSGSEGGAIWGSPNDHLTVQNSIVLINTPQPELFGFGNGSPSVVFSDACNEAGGPSVAGASSHNICADPKLDDIGEETAFSPTLDAGSNALVPSGVTTDIAGNPRIRASRATCGGPPPAIVDMGAFEFTGVQPPLPCPAQIMSVSIGTGTLRDHNGSTAVVLSCSPGAASFCDGTVGIDTVKRFAAVDRARKHRPRPRPRIVVLGHSHFHIAAGRSARVTIKLSSASLRKLGSLRSLRVNVLVSAQNAAHNRATASATRTLVLPKPKPKRKHKRHH